MTRVLLIPPLLLALAACEEPASGEGEGEGEEVPPPQDIEYRFETADGAEVPDDTLVLPDHDPATGPLDVDVQLRNLGAAPFELLTDPPLLLGGPDADLFEVLAQPPTLVEPGTAVSFTIRYAPAVAGSHEANVLFAYGVQSAERVLLTILSDEEGLVTSGGVRFSVYEGVFAALPDFDSLDATETGVQDNFDISDRVDEDNYAYVFDSVLQVPESGGYLFYLTSDDGSRLFIDGELVIDNDGQHAALEVSGGLDLVAGPHDVRVEYFELAGDATLVVEWEGPSFERALIPDEALSLD